MLITDGATTVLRESYSFKNSYSSLIYETGKRYALNFVENVIQR